MTHSVGRQSGAPFVSGPGATNNVTTTFTQDLTLGAKATPTFTLSSTGTTSGTLASTSVTDTGANPITAFVSRIGASTAATTRPTHGWYDASNLILSLLPLNSGANGALSWGTQSGAAPAFTTRSAGNRIILYSAISGTKVDNAIGVSASGADTWYTTQEGTSSYAHKFYAGQTEVASIRGDGIIKVSGNRSGFTTLGSSRMLDLSDTNGSTSNRVEIGFGYQSAATYAPVVIGSQVTDGNGFTFGSWYVATRGVTTDTAPTARVLVTGAGDVGIGKTATTGIILDVGGQLGLKSYTVATLPSAAVQAGAIVYASDAGGNGPCLVISNGTNWKRCDNTSTTVS